MTNFELLLCSSSRFGHIPGVPIGTTFEKRIECDRAGVHPGILAGIYGSKDEGARSVCLSGGYEDDHDEGETFTYTGCGGRDLIAPNGKKRRTGPQDHDQTFDNRYNRALQRSVETGKPVRVIRGSKLDSIYAPAAGYRYDGLYKVTHAWLEKGRAGYLVCRYTFVRLPGQGSLPRLSYELNLNNLKKRRYEAERRQKPRVQEAAVVPMRDERVVAQAPPIDVGSPSPSSSPRPLSDSQAGPSAPRREVKPLPSSRRLPLPRTPPITLPKAAPPAPKPVTNVKPVWKNGQLCFEDEAEDMKPKAEGDW